MDIGGWLRGLGLERYEQAFRENRIEADLLPSLTVEDLKDLGVTVADAERNECADIPENRLASWQRHLVNVLVGENEAQTILSSFRQN